MLRDIIPPHPPQPCLTHGERYIPAVRGYLCVCAQEHQGNAAEAAGTQRRCEFMPVQYNKAYCIIIIRNECSGLGWA